MGDILLFGIGQIADVAKFYIDYEGTHQVVGFTVDDEFLTSDFKDDLPVVPWSRAHLEFPPSQVKLFCPLSYSGANLKRKMKFEEGSVKGYEFHSFIHPKSHFYGTPVGKNCFILEANVIQPFVEIGDNCVIWSGNHIGHHSKIGSHCFIASHVVISGAATIGERCFLGVNATVRDNITIGEACVIGAGATVMKDVIDLSVLAGPRTKPMRTKSHQLSDI